jgi:dTDP-L-rhamnose 4-epimerase
MKVLLTGGAGFIGQHVLRRLLANGHEANVLDSLRPDVHAAARWQAPTGAELHVADIRDREAIDRALHGVDAVLHLAAKVGLGVDVGDLPDYASSNDAGTAELLAGMARAGVSRLTLASSMVVYGEGFGQCNEHGPVTPGPRTESALASGQFEPPCPICGKPLAPTLVGEDAPLDPRNAYASSKVAQEFYANNWARVTGGSVAALRYHNVYGPACRATRPTRASQRSSHPHFVGVRRRKSLRTAPRGAILCTSAMSRRPRCWPANGTSPGSGHLTSGPERRVPWAIWRMLWPQR